VALLCRGHLLIEDVPGTGKTMLAKAVARSLGCSFRRIQFTPDLLPSDVTGLSIYNQKTQEFEFRRARSWPRSFLADEINRATPKTQSALLESMEEHQATIDGTTYQMPEPSSSSPPRPDRVRGHVRAAGGSARPVHAAHQARLSVPRRRADHPRGAEADAPLDDLREVLDVADLLALQAAVREVYVDPSVANYIVRLVNATRTHPDVYLGASPRGSLALYRTGQALAALAGRDYVIPDDIKALAEAALAHRLIIRRARRCTISIPGR